MKTPRDTFVVERQNIDCSYFEQRNPNIPITECCIDIAYITLILALQIVAGNMVFFGVRVRAIVECSAPWEVAITSEKNELNVCWVKGWWFVCISCS